MMPGYATRRTVSVILVLDHHGMDKHHDAKIDRYQGVEFDAIVPDEHGFTFFFKGEKDTQTYSFRVCCSFRFVLPCGPVQGYLGYLFCGYKLLAA